MNSSFYKMGLAAFLAANLFSLSASAATHHIAIEGVAYSIPDLEVHVGDKVIWENKDLIPHTVTSQGNFDSKQIDPGKNWTLKAAKKGNFTYVCSFHPNMKARLIVK